MKIENVFYFSQIQDRDQRLRDLNFEKENLKLKLQKDYETSDLHHNQVCFFDLDFYHWSIFFPGENSSSRSTSRKRRFFSIWFQSFLFSLDFRWTYSSSWTTAGSRTWSTRSFTKKIWTSRTLKFLKLNESNFRLSFYRYFSFRSASYRWALRISSTFFQLKDKFISSENRLKCQLDQIFSSFKDMRHEKCRSNRDFH